MENLELTQYGIPSEDYNRLAKVDLSKHQRVKQRLTYIPWGVAIQVMKQYDSTLGVDIEKTESGDLYHGNEKIGYYVMCYLTRNGNRVSDNLIHAIRDYRNNPIKGDALKITDVTNAIQRAITKCIAINTGIAMSLYSQIDESIDFIQSNGNIVTSTAYTTWKSKEDGIKWAISKGLSEEEANDLMDTVEPDAQGRKSKNFFYAVEALVSTKEKD